MSHTGPLAAHCIDTAVFDLSLGAGMAEWGDGRELCAVVERELLSVIDEVFDDLDTPLGRIDYIDRLDIDLGSLSFDGSWAALRERLRERLRDALAKTRRLPPVDQAGPGSVGSAKLIQEAGFEPVEHFLCFGVLPPRSQGLQGDRIGELVRELARNQPQRLAELIRRPRQGAWVAMRLAGQLPETALEQLAEAFRPGTARVARALLGALQQLGTGPATVAGGTDELRRTLWPQLLLRVAAAKHRPMSEVIGEVVEALAHCSGLPADRLLSQLVEADSKAAARDPLSWLPTPNVAQPAGSDPATPLGPVESTLGSGVLRRAESTGRSGRFDSDAPASESLVPDDLVQPAPGWRERPHRLLQRVQSGELTLTTLCRGLGSAELRRLVRAMLQLRSAAPADMEAFLAAEERSARQSASARAFHRQVLQRLVNGELVDLEAIATEIACDEEPASLSRFHRAAAPDLQTSAADAAGRDAVSDAMAPEPAYGDEPACGIAADGHFASHVQAVSQVAAADGAAPFSTGSGGPDAGPTGAACDAAHQVPSASQRLFRAYDLYAQLVATGVGAGTGLEAKAEAGRRVELLARLHPDQVHRLVWELKHGILRLQTVQGRCSSADLRQLVHALMSATSHPSADGDSTQMLRALERYAPRAHSERRFYGQVLESLLADQPVDLELIVANSGSPTEHFDQGRVNPPRSVASADPATGADAAIDQLHGTSTDLEDANERQLGRLLERLKSGELSLPALPADLGFAEYRQLVEGLLATLGPHPQALEELRQAIASFAQRADNSERYYRAVLEGLLGEAAIDLEAIAAGARSERPAEAAAVADTSVSSAQDEPTSKQPATDGSETLDVDGAIAGASEGLGEDALQTYLSKGRSKSGVSPRQLIDASQHLMARAPARFAALLRRSLSGEQACSRLADLLPERLLTRALFLLAPAAHARLQRYADAIVNACYATPSVPAEVVMELKWRLCFQLALAPAAELRASSVAQRFSGLLDGRWLAVDTDRLCDLVRERLAAVDRTAGGGETGRLARLNASGDDRGEPLGVETAAGSQVRARLGERTPALEQGVRVGNAGLVLAAPFLPRLFSMLELLHDGAFANEVAQERAAHLLQHMVTGETDSPEYELTLNKVLCGWEVAKPIGRRIVVTERERDVVEGLLRSMIQHWQALKQTSVAGLRECFLQREGILRQQRDGWRLSVKPRPFDVLLDRIPWGFSVIKQSWMEEVIHVDWR